MQIMRELTSSAHCWSAAVDSPVVAQPGIVSRNARTRANMYRRMMNCMSLSWKLPSAHHGLRFLHPVKSAQNARKVLGVYKKRTLTLKKKKRELKERVKNVSTFSDLIHQSIFIARIRNHYKCYFI